VLPAKCTCGIGNSTYDDPNTQKYFVDKPYALAIRWARSHANLVWQRLYRGATLHVLPDEHVAWLKTLEDEHGSDAWVWDDRIDPPRGYYGL